MKRTKYIPAIVTLIGCLSATIITLLNRYSALQSMIIILVVLVVFYVAGQIIRVLVDKYLVLEKDALNEESLMEEDAEGETSENKTENEEEAKKSEES